MAAPVTMPHVAPMAPPEGVQFEPLQQRLGLGEDWGVHVSPVLHAPVVSQRQPRVPTMHVEATPVPEPLLPELEAPEEPPELDNPPELLPDPVDESSPPPNEPAPLSAGPNAVDEELPQAHITRTSGSDPTMPPRPASDVRSAMILSSPTS
jgi:hypothetical protein